MFLLSDPNEREEMDSTTKIVNIAYIVLGTLLGLATGLYVYRLTMQCVSFPCLSLLQADLTYRCATNRSG